MSAKGTAGESCGRNSLVPALLSQMEEAGLNSSLPLPSCHLRVIAIACSMLLPGFKGLLLPFPLPFMWFSPILALGGGCLGVPYRSCLYDSLLGILINEAVSSLEAESSGQGTPLLAPTPDQEDPG